MDERVLLVEDDASIRETTALGLEAAGSRVTGAADGREGLDATELAIALEAACCEPLRAGTEADEDGSDDGRR